MMDERYELIYDLFKTGYTSTAITQIEILVREEVQSAVKDAERYRWLRRVPVGDPFWVAWVNSTSPEDIDAAIDRNMHVPWEPTPLGPEDGPNVREQKALDAERP